MIWWDLNIFHNYSVFLISRQKNWWNVECRNTECRTVDVDRTLRHTTAQIKDYSSVKCVSICGWMCGLWASVEWDKSMKYSCSLAQSSCQILPKKRLHHLSVAQIRIQSVPVVSRRGEASLWEVEMGNRIYHINYTILHRLFFVKLRQRSLRGH